MNDIRNKEDIKILVNGFYDKIQTDDMLGPIFAEKIPADRWPVHLEIMYSFWNSVLFAVQDYTGRPFPKHQNLPVNAEHFNRWVSLFSETVDRHFEGAVADDAKRRAQLMGELFLSKIERFSEMKSRFIQ